MSKEIKEFRNIIEEYDKKIVDKAIGYTPEAQINLFEKFPKMATLYVNDLIERLSKERITLYDLKLILHEINIMIAEFIIALTKEGGNNE